jgi:hypothetical protein
VLGKSARPPRVKARAIDAAIDAGQRRWPNWGGPKLKYGMTPGRCTKMQCAQFEQAIEEQPDGPLPAAASLHLEACDNCRVLWNDLDVIRATSREWGAEDPVPSPRIWIALRAQLESEGLIHAPIHNPAHAPHPAGWLAALFGGSPGSAPRLSLAGACLTLLLVAGALTSMRIDLAVGSFSTDRSSGGVLSIVNPTAIPARSAPNGAVASEADLNQTLERDIKRVMAALPGRNPSLAISLQQNLGIVDNLIAVCEKSMREQPDNPVVRQYLYGAYQQKAVLLSTAIDRTTLEDR